MVLCERVVIQCTAGMGVLPIRDVANIDMLLATVHALAEFQVR